MFWFTGGYMLIKLDYVISIVYHLDLQKIEINLFLTNESYYYNIIHYNLSSIKPSLVISSKNSYNCIGLYNEFYHRLFFIPMQWCYVI